MKTTKAKKTTYRHEDGGWVGEAKAATPQEAGSEKGTKDYSISVRSVVVAPGMSPWLPVTSKKTGYKVFVPLPIRLIQQPPDSEGGCIVRGAVAGVAAEFPDGAWFLPIDRFLDLEATCGRASFTALLCQGVGLPIPINTSRGRTHRYYRVDRLLAALGAVVPEGKTVAEQASLLEVTL